MAQAEIKAVITADDRASKTLHGFAGQLDNTGVSAGKLGVIMGAVAGVVQSVTTKAIDALSGALSGAVSRVDTLANANRVFSNMGFNATQTQGAMDALKQSILGLPTPLDKAVQGMQMIASTTGDIGKSQQIFSALNNAIIGFGGTADNVQTAVVQLSQGFANNRIGGQEWLSMMNNQMGPALNAIAKQMGLTTGQLKEGLSDGSISVQKFQDALIQLNTQGGGGLASLQQIAKDSTAGIGTSFENAKTAVIRGLSSIVGAIGQSNISSLINNFGDSFEKFFNAFGKAAGPGIAVFFDALGQAMVAAAPAMQQVATILGGALSQILTALAPILPPLAVALADIALFFAKIVEAVAPFISQVIGALTPYLPQIVDAFNQWLQALTPLLPQITQLLIALIPLIPPLIELSIRLLPLQIAATKALVVALTFLINILTVTGIAISGFIQFNRDGLHMIRQWPGVVQDAFTRVGSWFGWLKNIAADTINSIVNFFSQLPGRISGAIGDVGSSIGRTLHIPGFATGVQNFGGGLAVVGERGPELVNLPRGSDVIPNNQVSLGSNQNTTININVGLMTGSAVERRDAAMKMFEDLKDIASSRGQTVSQMIGSA